MTDELTKILATPYKTQHLLLAPSLKAEDFDSHGVDCPFPFWHEGSYWMLYLGFDGIGYRTGLACSADLLHWEKRGLLIDRGPAGSPTEFNVALSTILREPDLFGRGDLVRVNGRFLGVYQAYPEPGYENGVGYLGLAWSDDLRNWQLDEPCLRAEQPWELGCLYKPSIFRHGERYYIFYNAKEKPDWPWHEQIGVAWSDDLRTWHKHPTNPIVANGSRGGATGAWDCVFAADPQVFSYRDIFVMFYYGRDDASNTCDGAAWSRDLLHWEKLPEPLITSGGEGSLDSRWAHKPGIIAKDGILYHFYCAVAPADNLPIPDFDEMRGITLATSQKIDYSV